MTQQPIKNTNIAEKIVKFFPLISIIFVVVWEFSALTSQVSSLEEKIKFLTSEVLEFKETVAINRAELLWVKSNCCKMAPGNENGLMDNTGK